MALPKLATPEFETVIPSTKEPIKFRPFLVKEEKILYMALESGDTNDIKNGILSILDNCILTPGVNVNEFATYDVEYLFLKLRSKSVGEIISLNIKHQYSECEGIKSYELNLDDVEIHYNEDHKDTIMITDKVGIKMKMPNLTDVLNNTSNDIDVDSIFKLLLKSVECIFDEENVYDEFSEDELKEFMDNLTQDQFLEVQKFFDTIPKLYHSIEWTCDKCGETETIELQGLQSFFI
jgi:hypothetical protein